MKAVSLPQACAGSRHRPEDSPRTQDKPELFNDLPPIPANVQIGPEYVFKP
jgi:hypothetical protein